MRSVYALATLLTALASAPAHAQWGFGIEVGPRIYYESPPAYFGPPPVYYEPPVIYEPGPEIYYEEAPIVRGPAPSRVIRMEAPEDVEAELEAAGYQLLEPIDRRGALFTVTANAPNGDLVALEISIFTGEIERSSVLQARYAAAPPAPPAVRRKRAPEPALAPAPRRKPVEPAPAPAAATPSKSAPKAAPPEQKSGAGTTLRDRLHTTPSDPAEPEPTEPQSGGDPLVVY